MPHSPSPTAHHQAAPSETTLREAFDLHDHNGNQSITSQELGNALRSVGKRLTEENVASLVRRADADHGGSLSFDDFKNFVGYAAEIEKRDDDIKQAFKVFDKNGDGTVDLRTFRHALTTLGDKLSAEQVDTLLSDARVDESSDSIDYDKFMQLIQLNV